jgi:hypothetical protein
VGAIEVGLRLPDGARYTRRFLASKHTVGHVAALAAAQGVDMARHQLALRFPRRVSLPSAHVHTQLASWLCAEQQGSPRAISAAHRSIINAATVCPRMWQPLAPGAGGLAAAIGRVPHGELAGRAGSGRLADCPPILINVCVWACVWWWWWCGWVGWVG